MNVIENELIRWSCYKNILVSSETEDVAAIAVYTMREKNISSKTAPQSVLCLHPKKGTQEPMYIALF